MGYTQRGRVSFDGCYPSEDAAGIDGGGRRHSQCRRMNDDVEGSVLGSGTFFKIGESRTTVCLASKDDRSPALAHDVDRWDRGESPAAHVKHAFLSTTTVPIQGERLSGENLSCCPNISIRSISKLLFRRRSQTHIAHQKSK